MARCDLCSNDYDKTIEITYRGQTYDFDCFECAISALAPECEHCGCRIIGHGLEMEGTMYCCAHCAEADGYAEFVDRL